ncbi:CLUMA_CG015857, isoform A [Clunio marinus]|uniref:CLUMA_CG015857, isoform A n=1 Tax=Clunio marinus TaxID=568069 RepID=A0A1J1ITG0_9DIPT|nr:CLUMA_CG015857, isoform A [Clunio marinus]
MRQNKDPLPTSTKFCFLFDLKPSVGYYINVEYIVWILLMLSSINLEIECIEKKDLLEFENVLRQDLYYTIIFGKAEPIPHENARSSVIFLNTVLVVVFLLYFLFTPFLLVGILRSSPNMFIPYLIYDIIMINLSGCFFIIALIVWNLRMFWICFIFFILKLNSSIGVFSLYKECGGIVNDESDVSFTSGLSTATTMESICEVVNV